MDNQSSVGNETTIRPINKFKKAVFKAQVVSKFISMFDIIRKKSKIKWINQWKDNVKLDPNKAYKKKIINDVKNMIDPFQIYNKNELEELCNDNNSDIAKLSLKLDKMYHYRYSSSILDYIEISRGLSKEPSIQKFSFLKNYDTFTSFFLSEICQNKGINFNYGGEITFDIKSYNVEFKDPEKIKFLKKRIESDPRKLAKVRKMQSNFSLDHKIDYLLRKKNIIKGCWNFYKNDLFKNKGWNKDILLSNCVRYHDGKIPSEGDLSIPEYAKLLEIDEYKLLSYLTIKKEIKNVKFNDEIIGTGLNNLDKKGVKKYILKLLLCSSKRFVVFDNSLFFLDDNKEVTGGHANMIIVDTHKKLVEIFEPVGNLGVYSLEYSLKLKKKMYEYFFPTSYKIKTPYEYLPLFGVQKINEDIGSSMRRLCQLYSLYYTILRVQNPEVDSLTLSGYLTGALDSESTFSGGWFFSKMKDGFKKHKGKIMAGTALLASAGLGYAVKNTMNKREKKLMDNKWRNKGEKFVPNQRKKFSKQKESIEIRMVNLLMVFIQWCETYLNDNADNTIPCIGNINHELIPDIFKINSNIGPSKNQKKILKKMAKELIQNEFREKFISRTIDKTRFFSFNKKINNCYKIEGGGSLKKKYNSKNISLIKKSKVGGKKKSKKKSKVRRKKKSKKKSKVGGKKKSKKKSKVGGKKKSKKKSKVGGKII